MSSPVSVSRSYCQDHSPTQSLCVSSNLSLPNSCSICLEAIEPVLSYSILKCPCCHASWFHRDCVQVSMSVLFLLCCAHHICLDFLSESMFCCKLPVRCQRQAHSAGLFFFRCTLCNNQDNFREEMLRMGIFIPERYKDRQHTWRGKTLIWDTICDLTNLCVRRDASWELEANAFSELLEVYQHCDAPICQCNNGRTHSAKLGYDNLLKSPKYWS